MQTDQLKIDVKAVLGDSLAAGVCIQLVDKLVSLPEGRGHMLTYTSLQKMLQRNEIDNPLITAVSFLTSSKCAILDAHGQFIDDDGEEYELEDADFQRLLMTGELAHPNTGENVDNPRDKVTPVFALRNEKKAEPSE
ncbi:hypothetical protein ROLI_003760 [Roseobacter fucihabitans]|uniref:Uncharacterized protein n=1 Tax=Roseobacter fucihabitans TaxID=1537242 RepID=A0ABZ2BML7_9RHOB|nr:hypothetical protein [Roseobacter litoralis]MBC6963626.1 hypothetical protein [Roseobacter litoralis]